MTAPLAFQPDLKHMSSSTYTTQPLPSYQNPQPAIYVQQQPGMMANPMLYPQGTGTSQQIGYPPQATQPMMNPMLYSPQPVMQQYSPMMQQPQYVAQTGELYRAQMYAGCANGQHQWNTVYGPAGIITAIICFPIGLLALLVDKKNVCARCQTSVPA